MKLNKIALGAAMALGLLTTAASTFAADTDAGSGKVTFVGKVIDAPCSLIAGSEAGGDDQTVNFGQVGNSALSQTTAEVNPTNFKISLVNCVVTSKKVNITFTGAAGSDEKMFSAKPGVNLGIKDGSGTQIENGTATSPKGLAAGNNDLQFTAFLQGDGTSAAQETGAINSVVNFRLAYN